MAPDGLEVARVRCADPLDSGHSGSQNTMLSCPCVVWTLLGSLGCALSQQPGELLSLGASLQFPVFVRDRQRNIFPLPALRQDELVHAMPVSEADASTA